MQAPEIYETVGLPSDQFVDELGKLFAQHEIPLGRVNKHLVLNGRDIDEMERIVSDREDPAGNPIFLLSSSAERRSLHRRQPHWPLVLQ